jgi:hypothetical protein
MWRPELSFTFLFFFLGDLTKKNTNRLPLKKTPKKEQKFSKTCNSCHTTFERAFEI